ncbi:MAG: hypothetical protein Q7T17_10030 [Microbacterium sp.]|uniref:hypothetical protein n=1 Tax=Microbacterium sp. TaxID=51671 RepID=UPI00271855A3|nr:hypothetical protein [Microbacterium sp.]MDO8383302.1 hypothetical protein [Microbacterium sp.]
MTSKYRTEPQVKFKAFRDLEKRRVAASDNVWALLVGSKLAVQTLSDVPDQTALLADQYPDLAHVQRMNQRLDRAGQLLSAAEREVCTMALNFAFGLHEDFVKSCIRLLVTLGKASNGAANSNSDTMHERFATATAHSMNADALELFHLTRKIRNAYTHAAGLVREDLVTHYESLTTTQRETWTALTREPFRVPSVGESASLGVPGLIGALAVQKRLAYDVNLGLQKAIPRDVWADIAVSDYIEESRKTVNGPTALRSVRGYQRPGFAALELKDDELAAAIERKKSGTL